MAEFVMVDQQGRTCTAGTPEEVNNLLCEGYTLQEGQPEPPRPSVGPKVTDK